MVDLKTSLIEIHEKHKKISWSHPRALIFSTVLAKYFDYHNFLEIGAWLGAVPKIISDLQQLLEIDQFNYFLLIDNFEYHPVNIPDAETLQKILRDYDKKINIDVAKSDINLIGALENNLKVFVDTVHFDSVKWQTDLIVQFEMVHHYCHGNTLYIFDDYIAEWPDVIYCVDYILKKYKMKVIATFGPKIYIGTQKLKREILKYLKSLPEEDPIKDLFNVRETIKHGLVISSGKELMI